MYSTAISVGVGLTIGNFIWQAFKDRDWDEATKLSFFQAVALGVFLLAMTIH